MKLIIEHRFPPEREAPLWAEDMKRRIGLIIKGVTNIMATMAELQAAVSRNNDAEDSVLTLLKGIAQQLKDAQATGDPAAIQTVIDQMDASTEKLSAAVVENTPGGFRTPPANG